MVLGRLQDLKDYLLQVRGFRRDIRLFLVFNLFSNVGIGVFLLLYNLYLVQIGFDEGFIGIYNATSTIALAAVAMVMGPLIGRFGGWHCITFGTILFIGASTILVLLGSSVPILAVSLFAGAGTAFLITPILPFIFEWERPEKRGTAAAFAFSINALSLTLGAFIGGWSPRMFHYLLGYEIESVMSYRLALVTGLAVAGLGLIPLLKMREARRKSGEEEGEFSAIMELPPTRQEVRRNIVVFAGTTGVLALGVGAVMPFYNVYLNSIGARPSRIGMIFAAAGIISAFACLIVPAVARRWGEMPALFWIRILPVPIFLGLIFMPHLAFAAVAHVARTTAISMSWPIDSDFMGRVLPARTRATGFSIRSGLWNIGYAASSFGAGWIILWFGYNATFLLFAICTAVSTSVLVGYFRSHPKAGRAASRAVLASEQ